MKHLTIIQTLWLQNQYIKAFDSLIFNSCVVHWCKCLAIMFLLNQTYAPLKTLSDLRALSDLIQMILMMEHILIYYKFWKTFHTVAQEKDC